MHGYNVKMMGHLVSGDIQEAKRTLQEIEQNCAYDNLNCVQALCHSSFNIDNILGFYGSHESIGYPIASKCEQLYPDDWTIRSRRLGCQVSLLQSQYFKDRISKDVLREKLLKLEEDLASMDFNGTESDEALEMVWGLLMTLKLNVASQDEILKMISDANTILGKYPHFCSVVATGIQAVNALYTNYLKDLVPHEEIERLYKYVEMNPDYD